MSATKTYVAVIGSGEDVPAGVLEAAEEVGRLVAEAGAVLMGGGKGGVMEAACRGARSAGGLTVAFLPSLSRKEANPYVEVALPTGLGHSLRNFLTVRAADVLIMLHGEVGTLSEAVLAYQHGKPLVALSSTGGWAERLKTAALGGGAHLDSRRIVAIRYAETPAQAVALALSLVGTVPPPGKI